MIKVMTIVGTRPELIKMARVIAEFDKNTQHILVHTGQNFDYELNEIFFKDLKIRKPDYFLDAVGENPAQTIGRVIEKSDQILRKEKPDAVLLYGDTNSCLAVISAKRLQIPVFHMEAGNRCFDQRVPEELNRKVLDHLSDINFVLTEHARSYLIAEGINKERIIKTGSHMKEVLDYYSKDIESSKVLTKLNLTKDKYFIVSAHREENIDYSENLNNLIDSLNAIAEQYSFPIVVSTHPRTQKKLDSINALKVNKLIKFMKPLGFFDYVFLQKNALCVISDSGTIFEETSLLNLTSITIRNAHERPEGNDEASVIMSGLKKDNVLDSLRVAIDHNSLDKNYIKPVSDYDGGYVSKKILRIVMSYIGYVNRVIWSK